jgi:hypothetical protein
MSIRHSVVVLVGVAAFAFAACSSTGASVAPSVAATPETPTVAPSVETSTAPSVEASMAPSGSAAASMSAGMQSFCTDFQAKIAASWPNIDAATAASLATSVQEWANSPDLAPVKTDLTTIGTWVATQVSAGAVASPPAEVTTAFNDIKTFADSHC